MTTAVQGPVEAADALWRAIDNIEGWLHPMEAWVLHEEVCQIDRVAPVVVEIGSWKGRSAVALGLAVKRRGAGHVTAIDPQEDPERRSEYYANLERAGVADVVTTLELLSHDARAQFGPASVDVLWIDGSHEWPDVVQDVEDWTPTLTDGAVVAFNDPWTYGVNHVLRDRVASRGGPFRNPRWVVNSVVVDHRPNAPWTRIDERARQRFLAFLLSGRQYRKLYDRAQGASRFRAASDAVHLRLAYPVLKRVLPESRFVAALS